jgi:TIR domain-containing protein
MGNGDLPIWMTPDAVTALNIATRAAAEPPLNPPREREDEGQHIMIDMRTHATEDGKTFICHADEDKPSVARPLAQMLEERGVPVWLDVNELLIGARLRSAIDAAIASCDMAIVVLSPVFYTSSWAEYEFDGLLSRHLRDKMPLFLILHNITRGDVRVRAPSLEYIASRSTSESTIAQIADEIAQVARRRSQSRLF